jgi:hypothetical protein
MDGPVFSISFQSHRAKKKAGNALFSRVPAFISVQWQSPLFSNRQTTLSCNIKGLALEQQPLKVTLYGFKANHIPYECLFYKVFRYFGIKQKRP